MSSDNPFSSGSRLLRAQPRKDYAESNTDESPSPTASTDALPSEVSPGDGPVQTTSGTPFTPPRKRFAPVTVEGLQTGAIDNPTPHRPKKAKSMSASAKMNVALASPDGSRCIITGSDSVAVQCCHFVPRSTSLALLANYYHKVLFKEFGIDSRFNATFLLSDMHQVWDAGIYIITPVETSVDMILHILVSAAAGLTDKANLYTLMSDDGIDHQWSLIPEESGEAVRAEFELHIIRPKLAAAQRIMTYNYDLNMAGDLDTAKWWRGQFNAKFHPVYAILNSYFKLRFLREVPDGDDPTVHDRLFSRLELVVLRLGEVAGVPEHVLDDAYKAFKGLLHHKRKLAKDQVENREAVAQAV